MTLRTPSGAWVPPGLILRLCQTCGTARPPLDLVWVGRPDRKATMYYCRPEDNPDCLRRVDGDKLLRPGKHR
jgi:hypothetical protein